MKNVWTKSEKILRKGPKNENFESCVAAISSYLKIK